MEIKILIKSKEGSTTMVIPNILQAMGMVRQWIQEESPLRMVTTLNINERIDMLNSLQSHTKYKLLK